MADREDFARRIDPFRRELLAHCYRMLGSVHDAEDLVQETFLRAWRSYGGFEGRASMRTWLYRIATNACLNALANRGRRVLPSGLAGPSDDPEGSLSEAREVAWLQPFPDALLDPESADPATIVAGREGMRLAMVAALQFLPARQRAVLILREVLGWRAAEVAELLDTTSTAVNSVLQRARAQLQQVAPAQDELAEPDDPDTRELLDRYATAFSNADVAGLMELLTDDAVWEMPPKPEWFAGRAAVGRLLAFRMSGPGGSRLVGTMANGQPAFGLYTRREDGRHHGYSIQVLTITGAGISRIVAFHDPELFDMFGLPRVLSPVASGKH